MRFVVFGLALLLVPLDAFAVPTTIAPEFEPRSEQYQRTCSPLGLYAHTSTTSGTAEPFLDGSDYPLLLKWGTQIDVTCYGDDNGNDLGYVIFHQEPNRKFLSSTRMRVSRNDGAFYVNDSSGASGYAGFLPVFAVPANGGIKYKRVSAAPFNGTMGSRVPTARRGRCTAIGGHDNVVGGPCNSSFECGSGGTCSTSIGLPDGVFVSLYTPDTDTKCFLEICM